MSLTTFLISLMCAGWGKYPNESEWNLGRVQIMLQTPLLLVRLKTRITSIWFWAYEDGKVSYSHNGGYTLLHFLSSSSINLHWLIDRTLHKLWKNFKNTKTTMEMKDRITKSQGVQTQQLYDLAKKSKAKTLQHLNRVNKCQKWYHLCLQGL